MGLVVYWYDAACFGIIGIAILGSVYVLWSKERDGRCQDKSLFMYESLLINIPRLQTYHQPTTNTNTNGVIIPPNSKPKPKGYVSSMQLWGTCWRGLHPGWLLGFRVISFFVLAGFLSWDIKDWGASIFIYYTEWSFSLVMIYFAIGSVISIHGCWLHHSADGRSAVLQGTQTEVDIENHRSLVSSEKGRRLSKGSSNIEELERAGFWGYLMQTAYQTCAGAVILTDIVFWCIIVPLLSNSRLGLNLLMGCMHTVNFTLLLLDTTINRLPFPWFRIAYFVLWSSAYVVFQWLIHLFGFTWWPYPFLELSTPLAPLWYFILAVFHIACYGLYAVMVRVKDSVFSQLFPHSYIRSY